jgi:Putative peptidoglycan binding domain
MIEALARIRNDFVLSRPAKKAARGRSALIRAADRVRSLPPRLLIGAVLSALLAGIGVNALVLQRERHPAPLFASPPQKIAGSAPPAASTPSPPPAPAAVGAREPASAVAAPSPPARTVASDSAVRRTPDAIGDLLRTEAPPADASHLVTAAQTALAKLGYPVKADGARGAATDQALREFERAHGLPVTTEITPRLVKQLNSAARAAAR